MWSKQLLDFEYYFKRASFIPDTRLQIVLLAVLLVLLIKLIAKKYRRDPRFIKAASFLPGPPEFPLLGNGLRFLLSGKGGIPSLQIRYAKKYGSIFRVWFGNQLWICVCDPQDIQTIYRSTKLSGRQTILPSFHRFLGEGIMSARSILRWKTERRIVHPKLTNNAVKSYIFNINVIVSKFVKGLHERANGLEFDVKKLFGDLTLDTFIKMEYGYTLSAEEKLKADPIDNNERIMKTLAAQIFLPILNNELFNFIAYRTFLGRIKFIFISLIKKILTEQKEVLQQAVGSENEKNSEISEMSFVPTLYKISQETGEEELLLDELLTMFIPATAPLARLLSYTLLMISIHPEVQAKLYREIHDMYGDDRDRWPEYDYILKLQYLDQVFKESLRLYLPVAISFRELDQDMNIRSYNLPAGTGILINHGTLHFNPDYYPNPFGFNPENFCAEAIAKRPKNTFIPFGGGTRRCLGQEYATLLYKLTLTAVVRNFEIHTSMKLEDVKLARNLFTYLGNANFVSLTPRTKIN